MQVIIEDLYFVVENVWSLLHIGIQLEEVTLDRMLKVFDTEFWTQKFFLGREDVSSCCG